MAEKVLIMGVSGTGKTTSIRNCDPAITAIVNPVGKALSFRGKFDTLNNETNSEKIVTWVKQKVKEGKKIIVIDDFQYILSIPYMSRIKEQGWDKWNDFGSNYFTVIDMVKDLPDDVTVYYLTHCETLDNGITTIKLIGKMLREKISIEGLFTTVLMTGVSEGRYYFFTRNNGKNTVKTPIGMFDSGVIDNDIAYVDAKVRNYYDLPGAKSDEEIKKDDAKAAISEDEIKPSRHRKSRKTTATTSTVVDHDVYAKTPGGTVFTIFKGTEPPKEEYTEITKEEYDAAMNPKQEEKTDKPDSTSDEGTNEEVPFEEAMNVPETQVTKEELEKPAQEIEKAAEAPKRTRRRRVRKEN